MPPDNKSLWLERLKRALPLLLFLFAFGLRLLGIGWGLPNATHHQSFHPDEPVVFAYSQELEPGKGDFDPGFYNYGTLYLTILRVACDGVASYGGGPVSESPDDQAEFVARCHLAGRVVSALAGAGTALFAFLMLRRRLGSAAGLAGGLLIAVAPGFVVHSRFQTVDALATFLLAVSAYFALRIFDAPSPTAHPPSTGDLGRRESPKGVKVARLGPVLKLAIWSGVFAGLSAGTKYTGVLGLLTLLAVLALAKPKSAFKAAYAGVFSSVVAFVLAVPGSVWNETTRTAFWRDFVFEMRHTNEGHGLVFEGMPSGFVWHPYNLVVGIGPLLLTLAAIGLAASLYRKDRGALALASFAVVYFLLIARAEVLFLRYTFPLYLALAYGFGALVAGARARAGWGHAAVGLSMLALGASLASATKYTVWMAGEDPRDEAARYLKGKAKGSPDAVVGFVSDPWFYSPTLYPEVGAPRWIQIQNRDYFMRRAKEPKVERYVPPNLDERFDWDVRLLDEKKPEYVVFSSFEQADVDRLRNMTGLRGEVQLQVDRAKAFAERLKSGYMLERVFGGTETKVHDMEYVRPMIWIWKRK